MDSAQIEEIFDRAFCDVTKRLVNLELKKVALQDEEKDTDSWGDSYREEIRTRGYLTSCLICEFSDELYGYIVNMMNNGVTPSDDEIHLFLNEYVNITCGFAVSNLNNRFGRSSRLTVPRFYRRSEPLEHMELTQDRQYWAYRTALGNMRICLVYSIQADEQNGCDEVN